MKPELLAGSRFELAFDTSALSEVLQRGEAYIEQLARDVQHRGTRIVLCEHVLFESIVKGPIHFSTRRAARMSLLAELLGSEIVIAAPLGRILERELHVAAEGLEFAGTPYLNIDEATELFEFLGSGDLEHHLEAHRDELTTAFDMEVWDAKDRELQAQVRARFPDASEDEILELAEGEDLGRWLLEVLLKDDADACDRVLAQPEMYRAYSTFSGYAHLNALAAATRSARRGTFAWLTSRAGDWTDALVVAHYAYATRLVTNDTGQLKRLRFLYGRRRAFVEPVQFHDLGETLG